MYASRGVVIHSTRACGAIPLAIVMLVLYPLVCQGATGIVSNPGFESGNLSPWLAVPTGWPGTDWQVTSTDAHSGAFSATATGNKQLRQNFAPVATNSISELSFWMKHPASASAELAVDFYYSDSTFDEPVLQASTTDWQMFNVTSRLMGGKFLTGIAVWGYTNFTTTNEPPTFFDDVTLTVVPEPAAIVVAAIPLVFLTARRRKRPVAQASPRVA